MGFFLETALAVLLLAVGFFMLVKGSSWFVDGSSGIADKLGVSKLVIALTVVAMGTSIPETAVSLLAAINGNHEMAIGNIVGTNTLNILLILGITAIISPLIVQRTTVKYEMPIMIFTALIFSFLGLGWGLFSRSCQADGMFSRIDGLILLGLFSLYIIYLVVLARRIEVKDSIVPYGSKISWFTLIFIVVAGLSLVIFGSYLTVKGAVKIANSLGVSERIIALTIVAFGTSLPELATSITATVKKQHELAVGNIVGSNIYNMLFIGGITSLVKPVPYGHAFRMDSLICIGTSAFLLLLVLLNGRRRISRIAGLFMLMCYGKYLCALIM